MPYIQVYMEKAPVINFFGDTTAQFVVAYSYLKKQVSFIFFNSKRKSDSWGDLYWLVKTSMSEIRKHGLIRDVAKLPVGKKINMKRKKVNTINDDGNMVGRRIKKRRITVATVNRILYNEAVGEEDSGEVPFIAACFMIY